MGSCSICYFNFHLYAQGWGSRVIINCSFSRTEKLELQVFKEHYDILQVGFQSPDALAGDLYAKDQGEVSVMAPCMT